MRLIDFSNIYSVPIHIHPDSGQKFLIPENGTLEKQTTEVFDPKWDLYHLDDYAVSIVSGPVYWLKEKTNRL